MSGIIYLRFKIRVRIKVSTIIKRTKNDPYTILPFSICSAVGKVSKEPKTSRKISITIMIATTIERIVQNAFFTYYSPFISVSPFYYKGFSISHIITQIGRGKRVL